jgi:hypothetical protein
MGILKTAATVAVASSVHGRIQRRQQQRWAAQDEAAMPAAAPLPQQAPAPMPPQAPAAAAPGAASDRLAQLSQLGDLKNAGVLTEAEFEREKARILGQ